MDDTMAALLRLDDELAGLVRRAEEPKSRKRLYDASVKTLGELLAKARYNREMAGREYPAQLLKGDIDLASPRQREAVQELSITLQKDPRFPQELVDITRALQLFYQEFFSTSSEPPREDPQAEARLKEFWADKSRGAAPDYQAYRQYCAALAEAEADSAKIAGLETLRPAFFAAVHARCLLQSASKELKDHLLRTTPWSPAHRPQLECFFAGEEDEGLLLLAADAISREPGGLDEEFLDRHLGSEPRGAILLGVLRQSGEDELRALLVSAVAGNHERLLTALINLIGIDQTYFYRALGQKGVQPEVYRKILESLFVPNSGPGSYGIDGSYAERLMNEHQGMPRNVIQTLQIAMPRGFDGHPLSGYFEFMAKINDEVRRMRQKKLQLDRAKTKDRDYCEFVLTLSDMETIRFIVFTYIFDCLKGGVFPAKIGMSRKKIRDCLQYQYEFENEFGGNKNIRDQIVQLWRKNPALQMETAGHAGESP